MARTLFGEARGATRGDDSKTRGSHSDAWQEWLAIGWVIRNRAEHPRRWGTTIRDACFQRTYSRRRKRWICQFSCYDPGRHRRAVERFPKAAPSEMDEVQDILRCSAAVLDATYPDPTKGKTGYVTQRLWDSERCPGWAKADKDPVVVGDHVFVTA